MRLLDRMNHAKISRRDFLKGSAVATAAVAGLSLVGCGEQTIETTEAEKESVSQEAPIDH